MKNILLLFALLQSGIFAMAQMKAVTENGDQVILYDSGTWEYEDKSVDPEVEIPVNTAEFKKGASSSFLLNSTKNRTGIWLDPKKWTFKKAGSNAAAEYEFQLRDGDLYAMIVNEKVEIPLHNLREIALTNARSVASDVQIVNEEYRNVNGLKVLQMRITGVIQGMKFTYFGYYYSGKSGTCQFITYTYGSLFSEYMSTSEELLNGLVETE
ncbi:MAG TPA: hypothetical protein VE870_13605 [Bacteroidales bacterium]|nr:hypothetical protein [Bacteroidales bacterium]